MAEEVVSADNAGLHLPPLDTGAVHWAAGADDAAARAREPPPEPLQLDDIASPTKWCGRRLSVRPSVAADRPN